MSFSKKIVQRVLEATAPDIKQQLLGQSKAGARQRFDPRNPRNCPKAAAERRRR